MAHSLGFFLREVRNLGFCHFGVVDRRPYRLRLFIFAKPRDTNVAENQRV